MVVYMYTSTGNPGHTFLYGVDRPACKTIMDHGIAMNPRKGLNSGGLMQEKKIDLVVQQENPRPTSQGSYLLQST